MTVGTIVRLKVPCLGNKVGTLGVGFNDYGDGVQFIFENGEYDGFSSSEIGMAEGDEIEQSRFLEEVGYDKTLSGYQFKNVMKVSDDFRKGVFEKGLSNGQQRV